MVQQHLLYMTQLCSELKNAIEQDIFDVKAANHEKLLERNDRKLELMYGINDAQGKLNELLALEMQNGIDINQYRDSVDLLEKELRHLYELNGKLAAIVLPVRDMYKQIIDDITRANGGSLFEVNA
jgi:hypothetical protein